MNRLPVLALIVLVSTPSLARADTLPATQLQLQESFEPKSETTALLTAIGTTAAGVLGGAVLMASMGSARGSDRTALAISGGVLMGLGLTVGPSAGHLYSGELGRGILTAVLRAGLLAGAGGLGGLGGALVLVGGFGGSGSTQALGVGSLVGALAAAVGAVCLAVYDIADAPDSARRQNRYDQIKIGVSPVALMQPDGSFAKGAALSINF